MPGPTSSYDSDHTSSKISPDISELLASLDPVLNDGEYVFVTTADTTDIPRERTICEIKEKEGTTVVIERFLADQLILPYSFIASWITLNVYSSLSAVGLTAAFSSALANHNISCNVVAGYYHDHIFVHQSDAYRALEVLKKLNQKT